MYQRPVPPLCVAPLPHPQHNETTMPSPSRLTLMSVALLSLAACGGGGGPTAGTDRTPADAGGAGGPELIVRLGAVDVASLAAANGLTVVDQFGRRPIWRLRLPAGGDATAALERLRVTPGVLNAELNQLSQTPEARARNAVWAIGGDAGTYASQWGPAAIGLPQIAGTAPGTGVRIAILDTGIDLTHPALSGRLARRADGRVLGRDFVDGDDDPSDAGTRADAGHGHGTHVAGLAALTAPGATLMPVRVLDSQGAGNLWVLAEALAWAVDPDGDPNTDDGAHVINLSLGTAQPTDLLRLITASVTCGDDDDDDDDEDDDGVVDDDERDAAVRCAAGHGAVVMAAAGNDGSDSVLNYPGAEGVPGSRAVTASNAGRQLPGFANRASHVKLAAPGEQVISTVPGGGWGVWSGSSMAAPWASGVAARVLGTLPPGGDDSRPTLRQWRPEDVAKRLEDRSALLCGTSIRQLDAAAAVQDLPGDDTPCP